MEPKRFVVAASVLLASSSTSCGGAERTLPSRNVSAGAPASQAAASAPPSAPATIDPASNDPRGCIGTWATRPPSSGCPFSFAAAEARHCFHAALRVDPTLEGASRVGIRIARDGTVCSLDMLASNMPIDMNRCVLELFERHSYPAPTDGCIDATVPMSFGPSPARP
jgi:hypothetical protein